MKTNFSSLYNIDYNISEIFAMNQVWVDGNTFNMTKPRPTDALLLLCGSDAKLSDSVTGEINIFSSGTLVYIPKGARYSWTFSKAKSGISSKLFEFILCDTAGSTMSMSDRIIKIEQPYTDAYEYYFDKLIKEYSKPLHSVAKLKAIAYDLFCCLSDDSRKGTFSGDECIYNGVRYLEDDPAQEKSINEIAKMCNISTSYFEKLFKEYAGCTPIEYRNIRRIEKGKTLIKQNIMSIEQIAFELGYYDSAYFCRVFKKITGLTPGEFKKQKNKEL